MRSSGCLTSSRVQFSMYTLPCTMSCPTMRTFKRMSCGPVSGTMNKTLGFDGFVVSCRPRRLEEEGEEAFRLSTSWLSELLPAIVILLDSLKRPRLISSLNSCVPSTWRTS